MAARSLHDPHNPDAGLGLVSHNGDSPAVPDFPSSDDDEDDDMSIDDESKHGDSQPVGKAASQNASEPKAAVQEISTTIIGDAESEKTEKIPEPKGDEWKTPFLQKLGCEAVKFFVGKEREPFLIHKDRLCALSDFFRAAFTGNFSEAIKQEMILDDVKVSDFAKFTEWVYQGSFPCTHKKTSLNELINLYFLADRFRCNGFKNLVMDEIQNIMKCESHRSKFGTVLSYRQIKRILSHTISTTDSPIRKFCAASISHYLRHGGLQEKVARIFKLDGFVKEYVTFQSTLWKEEDTKDKYDKVLGLRSDPRIRKRETESCGDEECDCFPYDFDSERPPGDKTGFPMCSFHVHGKDEKCESNPNYDSDCDKPSWLRDL